MAPAIASLTNGAKRAAYSASQLARVVWFTGHYAYGRRVMGPLTDPGSAPYAEKFGPLDRDRLKTSFRELFRDDWKNIATGVYKFPGELRRPPSFSHLWRQSRDYLRDAEKVARRKHDHAHSEVLTETHREKYPRYFLQNFHYQTDGWLSDDSADRYDMQVETLFTGVAGPMRRQSLPFIRAALSGHDITQAKLLDLGSGTGTFLDTVKENWPALNVTALDLSPAYLNKTRASMGRWKNVDFVQANAEDTGLAGNAYDVVTAVYLFHELPPRARATVAAEIARLLKPGGTFILTDTIQFGDEPGFDILLENFPRGFHEPYYDSFCRTDLEALMGQYGLKRVNDKVAFLTKVIAFQKDGD